MNKPRCGNLQNINGYKPGKIVEYVSDTEVKISTHATRHIEHLNMFFFVLTLSLKEDMTSAGRTQCTCSYKREGSMYCPFYIFSLILPSLPPSLCW